MKNRTKREKVQKKFQAQTFELTILSFNNNATKSRTVASDSNVATS